MTIGSTVCLGNFYDGGNEFDRKSPALLFIISLLMTTRRVSFLIQETAAINFAHGLPKTKGA